ncbi:hypothetical protein Tco_1336789 [Tanacetum coccineum]
MMEIPEVNQLKWVRNFHARKSSMGAFRGESQGLGNLLRCRRIENMIGYLPLYSGIDNVRTKNADFLLARLVPLCFAIFTFEPLTLSLTSLPYCDLESLTNILILCLILKASNQNLRKSLSLNLELS